MQRLTEKDGTPLHKKAIRYHMRKVRRVKAPLHAALFDEATKARDALRAAEIAHADAEEAEADALADVDAAELDLEDAIRDLDGDLEKLDRKSPGTHAQPAVFPHGFGEVIDPDGEAQLSTLPAFHKRLAPFEQEPALVESIQAVEKTEAAFKQALENGAAAAEVTSKAFAEELAARSAVRQQLESAYGRLRDFHKAQPKQAEKYFLKMGRREGKAAGPTGPGGGTSSPGAGGATGP